MTSRWDVVATDARPRPDASHHDVVHTPDVDEQRCREVFDGADAVIHLAAAAHPDSAWDDLLAPNVVGVHAVAAAAAAAGVRRLVLASSLHAVSAVPAGTQRWSTDAARPANLHGASKAWAEAVGSWIAATTTTTVVALRLGYIAPARPDATWPDGELSVWLSPRDATDLFRAAVETEGLTFAVLNGTSANRYPVADLADTRRLLGYQPLDDAWLAAGR